MDNNSLATIIATIITGVATILTSYGVMKREIATASATVSAAAEAWRPEGAAADMGDVAPARTPTVLGAVRDLVIVN
jgi:hypothetical protein